MYFQSFIACDDNRTSEMFSQSVIRSDIDCVFHLQSRQNTPNQVILRFYKWDT